MIDFDEDIGSLDPVARPQAPSWSPEAEAGLLGTLLLHNDVWDRVGDILLEDHFHSDVNRRIFRAIAELVNANKVADVLTVFDHIERSKSAGSVSLAEIHDCTVHAGTLRTARQYAVLIAEKALSRRFLAASTEIQASAFDHAAPVVERICEAQAKLESLQESSSKSEPEPIENFVVGALDRIQALADGEIEPGIPTGIDDLDRLLSGGLRGGKQIIIAARPSVGKSSVSQQICLNLATRGIPVAMFSQEMTKGELTDRAMCNLGRIDLGRYNTGKLEDEEWTRLSDAVEMVRNLPFYLDDQPQLTLQTIANKARTLKRKHNIKLLVLDYIQLCGTSNPKLSRHHQLEELSRGLKSLAKLLDISIITLSQLNREVEKRPGGRPIMADLKESGAIEEDADIVGLMWRHAAGEIHHVVGLDLVKNRQGRTGQLALHFQGNQQRWSQSTESLERQQDKSGGDRRL